MPVDYSLYLVTDGTPAILGKRKLEDVIKAAMAGGVTVVQYRDKHSETATLIETTKNLLKICQPNGVPLIINDRVDVALATGAQGVHLGQTDMSPGIARQLLGPNAMIGATVSSVAEAVAAVEAGADYLGIGTIFATKTKEDTKSIIGAAGARDILERLSTLERNVPTVAIGGINATNVQRVIFQSQAAGKTLDGVAVVSAVIAADDAKIAAQNLYRLITEQQPAFFIRPPSDFNCIRDAKELLTFVNPIIKKVGLKHPLCHNMTNLVVQNFAANVALAIGSSPIMANNGDEAPELATLGGALVVNMGSVTPEAIGSYVKAVQAYNTCGQPILLDPVGAGATTFRREGVKTLMANGYFAVIKGNENEIRVLLGDVTTQQKGVDSSASTSSDFEKASLAKNLAARERNIVVLTGKTDFISDGSRTYTVKNGSEYLGQITGSGCTLGTTIAACLAAGEGDSLLAALSGMLMFEIAAERADKRDDVRGPGTFVPAFIDELFMIAQQAQKDDEMWLKTAHVQEIAMEDIMKDY